MSYSEPIAPPSPTVVPEINPEPSPHEVRRWAREHGIPVGRRGPVNPAVLSRYKAARQI